jgi:IS605 OrfB family transposase
MEHVLTVVCKIQPTHEEAHHIDATLQRFAVACTYIHGPIPERVTNVMRMQAMLYYEVRERFGLSSNLAQQAFRRVSANRKTAKARGEAVTACHATSVQYDQRILSFWEQDWTVSLTLLRGRARFALHIGNYQRGKLQEVKPTSAQLCKHRNGSYAVHIQVKISGGSLPPADKAIGVDLGRNDIAHTSTSKHWAGDQIRRVRDRYSRWRGGLQRKATKGTRSTRRRCRQLLARLSGQEKRFQRWLNHGISKEIIQDAHATGAMVVLEDLTGIRERTNRKRWARTERRRGNSWAFYQLRQFFTYKAALAAVPLVLHPPAYTSQMCHVCHHIGSRAGKRFVCHHCGYRGDADYNAAKNLEILGLNVSQARGPWLYCQLQGS